MNKNKSIKKRSGELRENEVVIRIVSHESFVFLLALKGLDPLKSGNFIFKLLIFLRVHFSNNSHPSFF